MYAWLEDCALPPPAEDSWRRYIRRATGFAHAAGVQAALQYHRAAFDRFLATPCKCVSCTDGPTDDMSVDNIRSPLERAEAASRRPRPSRPAYSKGGSTKPATTRRQRGAGSSVAAFTPRVPGHRDIHGECFHTTATCNKAASDPKRQKQDKPAATAAGKA